MSQMDIKVSRLPQELQREVEDFVEFLLAKHPAKRNRKPTFSWFGALKEFRDQYTALQLQKKANEWRD